MFHDISLKNIVFQIVVDFSFPPRSNYLFAEIPLSTIEGCVVEIGDNCFEEEWTQLAADDVDMKMIVVKIVGL